MSGFFGGRGKTISTVAPKLGALNVQTSSFGMAIPLVYGQTRITANLIWYGNFIAIAHTETQSGGKGGGGVESSNTNYTYTVATAMGLCEGPITGINTVWASKEVTNMTAIGLSLFLGANPQTPWGFLTTNHPTEALGYASLAYVASPAYDLGSSANLPNHTFEVLALYNYSPISGVYGAKPDVLIKDYLTNIQYGVGFATANIGSLTQYNNYCLAAGILLSPAYTEQASAYTHIDELMQATNSAVVWSEGLLKILPYGDTPIAGAWGTFTPDNAVRYDLNDDDFLGDNGSDPVRVQRKTQADAYNQVQIEFLDSSNQYNVAIATASDIANIELYGLRPMQPVQLHLITRLETAQTVAQFILQRALYIRNTYEFTLGMRYCLLEPMDIVTITDEALGLNKFPVRITEIEDNDDEFTFITEEFLAGVSHSETYPSQTSEGYQTNYNVAPGNANAPVVFEPPTTLSVTPQIWLATSGAQFWGGAEVWVSQDNASYVQVGLINGGARHGVTTAALALGADPDTSNTLAVDLTVSGGTLIGGTLADRDNMSTLCFMDGELVSYQNAALTAPNKYNLTSLRRGAYGTARTAHLTAKKFARLDQAIFKYDYDPGMIGSVLYIKLRSFNIYGLQREDLAGLTPIAYNVTGANLGSISGLALAQPWVGNSVKIKWNTYIGADSYTVEIRRAGALKRSVTGIASTSYEYTYEDMVADGGPWRSIDINLYAKSSNGASSAAAVLTVSNPQIAVPAGLNATAGSLSIIVSATKPADTDWAGLLIYGSTTTGFTPGPGNLLFDGKDNSHTFTGLTAGVPIYCRLAFYDSYGTDSLNLSSEISATPLAAAGIRIVSALPTSGLDSEVVSLTTDHKIYRWNQSTTAWVTWVDGTDILAATITAGKLAADSINASNISAGAVLASKISVSDLAAINANMGSIVAGDITLNTAGFIRGGQTAYDTGNGFYVGNTPSGGVLSVGNATQSITYTPATGLVIKGDLVATGNIKLNGVTIPVSSYTAAVVALTSAFANIQSLGITTSGGNVFIASVFDSSSFLGSLATGNGKIFARLLCDGLVVSNTTGALVADIGSANYGGGSIALNFSHAPAAGAHTYVLQAYYNQAGIATSSASVNDRSMFAIEMKR